VKNSNETYPRTSCGGAAVGRPRARRPRRGRAVGSATRGEGSDRVERRFWVERPELEVRRGTAQPKRVQPSLRRRHGATQAQSKADILTRQTADTLPRGDAFCADEPPCLTLFKLLW
jgi:hypothetical protein